MVRPYHQPRGHFVIPLVRPGWTAVTTLMLGSPRGCSDRVWVEPQQQKGLKRRLQSTVEKQGIKCLRCSVSYKCPECESRVWYHFKQMRKQTVTVPSDNVFFVRNKKRHKGEDMNEISEYMM